MTDPGLMDGAMQRALELAAAVRGRTSPNPWVGCVVSTPDGRTFEGATEPPGGPHAEAVALAAAGDAAEGATLVCTLEPCSHHGRTPPCADAIVAAGVRRVVVALEDPDPHVAGRGLARLREAGIEVHLGVGAEAAAALLAPYLKHRKTGRPWVVLKLAASLDGRTAAPDGSSQWITGEAAREEGQKLRAEMGCVLIGAGAARCDDPSLTVRLPGVRNQPLRVVLDPLGELDPSLRLFDSSAPTLHVVARAGRANQLELPLEAGRFDTRALLRALYERGVTGVLVEGGAMTIARFIEQRTVDVIELFIAPKLLGSGPSWCEVPGLDKLENAMTMAIEQVAMIGEDLRVRLRPR